MSNGRSSVTVTAIAHEEFLRINGSSLAQQVRVALHQGTQPW